MGRVTPLNEQFYTFEWGMSQLWVSHVVRINVVWCRYVWIMSHTWMSHATHLNESCRASEEVVSYLWMSHAHTVHELCHICTHGAWAMSHLLKTHTTHILRMGHVAYIVFMTESRHVTGCRRGTASTHGVSVTFSSNWRESRRLGGG